MLYKKSSLPSIRYFSVNPEHIFKGDVVFLIHSSNYFKSVPPDIAGYKFFLKDLSPLDFEDDFDDL